MWFILIVFLQNDHMEAPEEQPKKTKLFFMHAVEHWDAEFYVKVNDDIYLNIGKWSVSLDYSWKDFTPSIPN